MAARTTKYIHILLKLPWKKRTEWELWGMDRDGNGGWQTFGKERAWCEGWSLEYLVMMMGAEGGEKGVILPSMLGWCLPTTVNIWKQVGHSHGSLWKVASSFSHQLLKSIQFSGCCLGYGVFWLPSLLNLSDGDVSYWLKGLLNITKRKKNVVVL